ncbi:hypothetical protein HGRIS_007363 [Hohenbuehelia grisea]|uniref:Protein ZIP4 homolog n=1 Tax=Hohenbuehelia grisea TaxID=104357 RepID=A0ABR3J5Z7_9AGAR
MSPLKRKSVAELRRLHGSIKDLLSTIKPQLNDPQDAGRAALVKDLHQVASLAQSFTERRPKSNKEWLDLADNLDQEGVYLWNISGVLRKTPENDKRALVAGLRLASFRLVEAGLDSKPDIATLAHVVQLASKTGATLADDGNPDAAASVLTSAAKYEELLRTADDPTGVHRQVKACASLVFFSSRMEAAWKEGNYGVAEFMSQKITEDDEQRLALLPPHQRELLASKLHHIGNALVSGDARHCGSVTDGARAQDAVTWLQKAFNIIEQLEEKDSATPGVADLRIDILRSLVRTYLLSSPQDPENLSRAEATLQELTSIIDVSKDHRSSEYLELRWQRLEILKQRKAEHSAVADALKSIIDHMRFSESSVTEILQELKALSHQHILVTAIHQHFLKKAVACHTPGTDFVDRLLLFLIFHCSKDIDQTRAMKDLDTAFSHIHETGHALPSIPNTACLTLIWQYGDRHYLAKRWKEAAGWYLAGSHPLFHAENVTVASKCLRKAALCYIEQREYATASAVIRRCPTNEATTQYVILMIAVHQGLDDDAIKAVQDMVKAPDFDRKMLLLATQLSHASEMKGLLLSVLEALLKTLKFSDDGETAVEAMSLLRCIIRLVIKLLAEPAANRELLHASLVEHFQTAKALAEAACAQNAMSLISKDVSWLWRTAYNCAVQGCADWEQFDDRIPELFEMARDLLQMFCDASPLDTDAELYIHLMNASFSALCGRVFGLRARIASGENAEIQNFRTIAADINACRRRMSTIMSNDKITDAEDVGRVSYFQHVLRVFETEMFTAAGEWEGISLIITEITHSDALAVDTHEAIADILWAEKDCPVNILYTALEAILHSCLDHSALSVEKFSRWLRAICTIILSRNTPTDRVKAIGYIEQAQGVIEEHQDDEHAYPIDERQWLLSTSYNTGLECFHASSLQEAQRWLEAATVLCRFVPNGESFSNKVSETYGRLLTRYSQLRTDPA